MTPRRFTLILGGKATLQDKAQVRRLAARRAITERLNASSSVAPGKPMPPPPLPPKIIGRR